MTRHITRRDALSLAAGSAITALAGCLDGVVGSRRSTEEPENAGELGTPAQHVTVTTTSQPYPKFEPQIVHLVEGGTMEWVVETGRHDVTSYHRDLHPPHRSPEGTEPWTSGRLTGAGAAYERTFDREGVYDYVDTQQVCIGHEIAGNVGRVVVGWPDPAEEPAMQPADPDLPQRVLNAFEMFDEETRPVLEAGP